LAGGRKGKAAAVPAKAAAKAEPEPEAPQPAAKKAKAAPKAAKAKAKVEVSEAAADSSMLSPRAAGRRTSEAPPRVLFSSNVAKTDGLEKMVMRLGGTVAKEGAHDFTHFVVDGFHRTENLLVALAAGKKKNRLEFLDVPFHESVFLCPFKALNFKARTP
jgi:hypothetical protein